MRLTGLAAWPVPSGRSAAHEPATHGRRWQGTTGRDVPWPVWP